MRIVSPYGKPVGHELRTIYGLDSAEEARDFVLHHIADHYGLHEASIERLEIAFGLTAKIRARDECFYLKFTSRRIHRSPEQLFPWLDYARQRDVLVPEVIRCASGSWFQSPLSDSCYDVVYLMRETIGAPMRAPARKELDQYAKALAQFHRVGQAYPHSVDGRSASWNVKLRHQQQLWRQASESPLLSPALLKRVKGIVQSTGECELSSTIVHGDFRFCHVFFEDGTLTGLIDVDMSTTGERWIDFCAGLLSGNSPELGNLLSFDELCRTLSVYHEQLPLTKEDVIALKATFAYAAVETLVDLSHCAASGTIDAREIESVQGLLATILDSTELLA